MSKTFWILAAPSHWLGLFVLATGLCLLLRRPRAAGIFSFPAVLILVLAGTSLLNGPMVRALENRYPRPPWPARVDGVLVLGSGFDVNILRKRHAPQANAGVNRLVAAMAVARHYPAARVVFTGGSGVLIGAENAESVTARYVFSELGLESGRLLLEPKARNTYENILFAKELAKPKPGEVWLLDTAAIDLPRAMAVARKLRWPLIAWPSDYITTPRDAGARFFDISDNLRLTDYAAHEWIGLLAYRLSGRAL
ncbi:MAG TPA: YdcF family protein [Rhizomicrobium sp.]|nr:YdcF family protein [Rhizomicrobium sp.]